jgi:uncharacterized damage-inducible protein DinB
MFTTVEGFLKTWKHESESTLKMMKALTDASLAQAVTPADRTLGRLAWHVTTTIREMMERTGLRLNGPARDAPVPRSAGEIASAYDEAARSLAISVEQSWNDATLGQEDEMYGKKWKRGLTLGALVHHQIHHRGQMTVLMRQAGLAVPGVYGPAREEWSRMGMPPPTV